MTTIRRDLDRCTALGKDGKPIAPCTTCARCVRERPSSMDYPWITIPPAFWNGERYVCEHHMEIKNVQC